MGLSVCLSERSLNHPSTTNVFGSQRRKQPVAGAANPFGEFNAHTELDFRSSRPWKFKRRAIFPTERALEWKLR